MKSTAKILFLTLNVLLFSCSNNIEPALSPEEVAIETPEVLLEDDDKDRGYGISSSKTNMRYNDVIMELYQEALENNYELAVLDSAIRKMSVLKNDSLKMYKKYNQTNLNYYSVANQYANRIKDSVVRKATVELFDNFESLYKHSVSKYDTLKSKLNSREDELYDQLVLMQLFVTKPMMSNYQNNELPNISELKNLLMEYEKLLKKTEQFTK